MLAYLNFKAGRNKIEVQLLKHKADENVLADIAGFLENKNIKKTVYSILKKIEPICGKIIVDDYAYIEMKEENENGKDKTAPQPNSNDSDLRNAVKFCEAIFEEKMRIYGYSFCFMHPETVTDQLYMKATILKKQLTDRDKGKRFGLAFFEGMRDEFAAVVNYGIIALRQGGFGVQALEIPESPMRFYSDQMQAAFKLIIEKGSEYGELWRKQRIGTFADMIYTKVRRLKGIEDRYRIGGLTKEDYHKFAEDQYKDMINYGLFGIVRLTAIIEYEKQMEGYARYV